MLLSVNPLSLISTIVDCLLQDGVAEVNPLSLISTIVDTKPSVRASSPSILFL